MNPHRLVWVLALLCASLLAPKIADACAPAPPRNTPVSIANESAIIVWDATSKTQHFIRRASFSTDAKDFGFLVPTPTQPELSEASDDAFKMLAKITEPRTVKMARPSGGGCIGCAAGERSAAPGGNAVPVEVLDQKRIAGQDVVVLKATDADALTKWLADHGYDFSDSLKDWVKPYIDAKWIITASKVAKDKSVAEEKNVASAAVRMTFETDKPFFPYREPEEKSDQKAMQPSRLLRVFFLSTGKVKGVIGAKSENWPGKVAWANKIEPADREKLLDHLKLPKNAQSGNWWLTEFEDRSSPRPGNDDVYFSPADNQDPVERPPHIQYVEAVLPGSVMAYVLVAYMFVPCLVRVWRRRSA